jgi:hypothetical protein
MTGILDTREKIDKSPRVSGPVTPLSKSHSRSRSVSYSAGFTKSAVPSWSGVSRYRPPPAFHSLDSEAVSYAHGGLCDLSHCTPPIRPALWRKFTHAARRANGHAQDHCVVLTAVAVTLKIRLDTPQGPQPLVRAIVTTHLQSMQGDLALP